MVSRKHRIETHFPEDRNCEVRKRTKITRAPCKTRTGEALRRAEKFGDTITADHTKSPTMDVNLETINHRYSVVVQDLATQWIQSAKRKLLRRRKGVYERFSSRHTSQKLFIQTIHWNWEKLVKIYPGITAHQRSTVSRRMVSPKERYAE